MNSNRHGHQSRRVIACAALGIALLSPGRSYAQDRVVALTTDYSTGSLSVLSASPPWGAQIDLTPACADAVVRVAGGLLYVVNRLGCDNIEVIDPASWSVLRQFSTGAESNPQDIVVLSPARAYVSCYETNDLLEVNPSTGAIIGAISLAGFADADGLCEMHRMLVRGNRLFVEVQRWLRQDPWIPAPPSLLAVVDLNTRQLIDADPVTPGVQGIALLGTNPNAPMQVDPNSGDILVPEAGRYEVRDPAGIERVDPVHLVSRGFLITEEALGGDLVDFAQWTASLGYAVVTLPGFNTALVAVNPFTGEKTATIYNPGGYELSDVYCYPAGYLFLADRDFFNPGIRVYAAASGTFLAGPIFTGLPPFELILLSSPASDVSQTGTDPGSGEVRGSRLADALGPVVPNPSRGAVRISWASRPSDRPIRLEVSDLAGRRLKSVGLKETAEAADLEWDGTDGQGRPVSSGVYCVRLVSSGGDRACRLARIIR